MHYFYPTLRGCQRGFWQQVAEFMPRLRAVLSAATFVVLPARTAARISKMSRFF
jgi:hypothetical protein